MSIVNLIADTLEVIKYVAAKFSQSSIILVGHSMGGAVAVKTLSNLHES